MSKMHSIEAESRTFYYCNKVKNQGGSSYIYDCLDEDGKKLPYVIKIMKDRSTRDSRFKKEINFQKNANNKYIVPCEYSGVTEDDKSFYIMPCYEKTLRDLMIEDTPEIQKLEWFLDICEAIKFTHSKNVIHRDIKPENIMQDSKNLVLGDFGIAHFHDNGLTVKGDRLANFDYHAPEQMKNSKNEIGFGTDIYALGLVLNELFTGILPLGKDSKEIGDVYPPFSFLDDIVSSMLVNDINKRENNIQNVINRIKFNFEIIQEGHDFWKEYVKISDDVSESFAEKIIEQAYEDIKLADNMVENKEIVWNDVNCNYHMNIGYSAKVLIDTVILIKIHERLCEKFDYEGTNYLEGDRGIYDPLDYKGKDREIFKEFFDFISGLKTIIVSAHDDFWPLKGCCVKHFQSLCDYHAKEILTEIKRNNGIIDQCRYNLLDAPILWIAGYIEDRVDIIKEYTRMEHFNFEDWVDIQWDRCSLDFDGKGIYEKDLIPKEEENEKRVLSKLKELFKDIAIIKSNKGYNLYFTYDDWRKYKDFCISHIDKSNDLDQKKHDLNNEIMDLCRRPDYADSQISLKLGRYDICNVFPKILFK